MDESTEKDCSSATSLNGQEQTRAQLEERIRAIAEDHLNDTTGSAASLLRRLSRKLRRQSEAIGRLQGEAMESASSLQSLATTHPSDLVDQ